MVGRWVGRLVLSLVPWLVFAAKTNNGSSCLVIKCCGEKVRLRNLIPAEYHKGYLTLHRSPHRLFTQVSLQQQAKHSIQTMERSWLFRVEAARYRAEMDTFGVAQDCKEYQAAHRAANTTVQMWNDLMSGAENAPNTKKLPRLFAKLLRV